jgi:hypothetical protein
VRTALILPFALAAFPLFARQEALPSSVSPDKHCRVVVVQSAEGIFYQIKDTSNGTTLLYLRSSYQPETGAGDWGFRESMGATVYWRKDSCGVALDEDNYRRSGTVLVARRTPNGFQQVPISVEALLQASKQPWVRGRLFFGLWGRNDMMVINYVGRLRRVPTESSEESDVSFTLDVANKGRS